MSQQGHTFYFIGIGGVGMSALARLCTLQGHRVFGYDRVRSTVTANLEKEGISIRYTEELEDLPKEVHHRQTQIIYTAAVPPTHKQLSYFIAQGYTVKKRALFMAELCAQKTTLAVAGTHGKTTTSAFLTHIFSYTNQSFTSIMGGFFQDHLSNLIRTGEEFMLVEADEYDRSFLHLHPSIGAITSMDSDHLDIYQTPEAFEAAFVNFSSQIQQQLIVAYGLPLEGLTYGVNVAADYRIYNVKLLAEGYEFDLSTPTEVFHQLRLNQLGAHNLSNVLCALAMADQAKLSMQKAVASLPSFPGIHRRMNLFRWNNKCLVDDYAHHPTEIKSVLDTLNAFYPGERIGVIFQPHLFSRTRDFYSGFLEVLAQFDEVVLLDIYPARELPIEGVSSERMLMDLKHECKKWIQKEQIADAVQASTASVFALLGAGDIGEEIQVLKSQIRSNENV